MFVNYRILRFKHEYSRTASKEQKSDRRSEGNRTMFFLRFTLRFSTTDR